MLTEQKKKRRKYAALFAYVNDEARKLILGEPEFQMEWFNAVQKELDFL